MIILFYYSIHYIIALRNGKIVWNTGRPCRSTLLWITEVVAQRCSVKTHRKHLFQSLFFTKDAGLRPAILLNRRLWRRCFPVSFAKFLRTPFLKLHLWWLILESSYFFLIGVHSMSGWTATTNYGVIRKRITKRLKRTGNLFRKNP